MLLNNLKICLILLEILGFYLKTIFCKLQGIHTFGGVLSLVLLRVLMRKCLSVFFFFLVLCLYFMLIAQSLLCNLVVGAEMRDILY